MIELHLIGYTDDAEHLVFDLGGGGDGRYTVAIDPDLLATVEQLRARRIELGVPVDLREEPDPPPPNPSPDLAAQAEPDPDPEPEPVFDDEPDVSDTLMVTDDRLPTPEPEPEPEPDGDEARWRPSRAGQAPAAKVRAEPLAKLTPAEIQARLRAGRSVRAVAAEAGTDRAWIERWLPPILAERERVLAEARRRRIDAPHARLLGNAVSRAFAARGVDAAKAAWTATRRADGRWRVSVRFEERGRPRTATWLMDPEGRKVSPASELAKVLAEPETVKRHRR